MKRNGSTEGIRKLFEAVSATLWDKLLGGARSLKTAFARFGRCVSASKQASDLYQVRMRLIKHDEIFYYYLHTVSPRITRNSALVRVLC